MEALDYAGIVLLSRDVATAVAAAASGRVPAPRRGRPPTDDPGEWLEGLVLAAEGTPLRDSVHRALCTVLRTGNSKQLGSLLGVAQGHQVFPGSDLIATLQRRQVYYDKQTAAGYAEAVGWGVARGHIAYVSELRVYAQEFRLKTGLIPAFLVADTDWFVDNLERLLHRSEDEGAARIVAAADELDADARDALADALKRQLERLPAAAGAALTAAWPDLKAAPQAAPEAPHRLDIDELPWRALDGRWYYIPPDAPLVPGGMRLRRGLSSIMVSRRAMAVYEIDEAEALQRRSEQARAMWDAGRKAVRHLAGVEAPDLERGLGRPAAEVLSDPAARRDAAARVKAARARLAELMASPEAVSFRQRLQHMMADEE